MSAAAEAGRTAGDDPLTELRAGGKAALARALARIEARPDDPETLALLDAADSDPIGHVFGLTGPPGVGKSSLANRLVAGWRAKGLTVGVIAVDPSSRRSGGALLGDRTRLATDPEDDGVFVRSMAARERLGGLAGLTYPAMVLMRAVFDRVLVETVGVGQSEIEVADLADTVAVCVQPASGDSLQFMKSGLMETPDLLVVTKADLGAPARRALADLKGALSLAPPRAGGRPPEAISCSALEAEGADAAVEALEKRAASLTTKDLSERRKRQRLAWALTAIQDRFGRRGVASTRSLLTKSLETSRFFSDFGTLSNDLDRATSTAFLARGQGAAGS